MRRTLITLVGIFLFPLTVLAAGEQVVDIDIEGMSCKFCAHSVQKNLSKIPDVAKAEVSIDTKKAHIVMQPGKEADIEELKKKISASGFTAVKVSVKTLE